MRPAPALVRVALCDNHMVQQKFPRMRPALELVRVALRFSVQNLANLTGMRLALVLVRLALSTWSIFGFETVNAGRTGTGAARNLGVFTDGQNKP